MKELFQGGAVRRKADAELRWFLGDPFTVLATADDTGGVLALMEFVFRPGSGAPPHHHTREDEFFYIVEGQLEFTVAGKVLLAGPGDFVQVTRDDIHHFRNPLDSPARVIIGLLPAAFLGFFLELSVPVSESPEAPPMPSFEHVAAVAAKYGCILVPPPGG